MSEKNCNVSKRKGIVNEWFCPNTENRNGKEIRFQVTLKIFPEICTKSEMYERREHLAEIQKWKFDSLHILSLDKTSFFITFYASKEISVETWRLY